MDDQILAAMLKQFAEFLCSEENFEYNITYFNLLYLRHQPILLLLGLIFDPPLV